jgi:non-specific serine/threonine protein kinase
MRATIDWSYRLLSGDEALLFRRLSVFRGGFTLESVQAVCGADLGTSVLDSLSGLVQKSMAVVERTDDSGSRYRLLESQLAYAADQLEPIAEADAIRRRHYEYFRDRLNQTANRPLPLPPAGVAERKWIIRESGNLWAALDWARSHTDDMGLSLAVDFDAQDVTGARILLDDLLAHSIATGPVRAQALDHAGFLAWLQGDFDAVLHMAESGVSMARELGDPENLALALNLLGMAHQGRGELAAAGEVYKEASALLAGPRNKAWAMVRNSVGILAIYLGDYAGAHAILTEVVTVVRGQVDVYLLWSCLDSLACAQLGLNDADAAAVSWTEALAICRDLSDDVGIAACLEGHACVASLRGDDSRALRLAAATRRMSESRSLSPDAWLAGRLKESQSRSRSRLGVRKSDEAWMQGWTMTEEQAVAYALSDTEPETGVTATPLTRREREVAKLVATGMTNRQIATRLFIAERSAEGHLERIRTKLGVRSRTDVATWAINHGLVATPEEKKESR